MEETSIEQLLEEFKDILSEVLKKYGLEESNLIKRMTISYDGTTVFFNFPDYVQYVENGRRSGRKPPVNKILEWMNDKKIGTPNGVSRESIAYAIATVIGKRGIKARPFLEDFTSATIDIISLNILSGIFDKLNINN